MTMMRMALILTGASAMTSSLTWFMQIMARRFMVVLAII